ncbi:MAG: peptidase C45 acyl-coenzyme A:6-aminopenicillanic acid acyl-transferase [Planctomycetales bacterium]|nr:peptidase C45 acyl-coenzyme A:6-aminopenicillanic acid acyl-transferase [Planctomycetales bacterium]
MFRFLSGFLCLLSVAAPALCAAEPRQLATELAPLLKFWEQSNEAFSLDVRVQFPDGQRTKSVTLKVARLDDESFDLEAEHEQYAVKIRRRSDRTALLLPTHRKAYVGEGPVEGEDILRPAGAAQRLVSSGSLIGPYLQLARGGDARLLTGLLTQLVGLKYDQQQDCWCGRGVQLRFPAEGDLAVLAGKIQVDVKVGAPAVGSDDRWLTDEYRVVKLERAEIERQLARGLRRALEVVAPSPELTAPRRENRRVAHGELRWMDGQRVVLLQGTPEEIGRAHGELLQVEATRCIDSVLYAFGTVETIRSGEWFRHRLEQAFKRLSRHIPDRHHHETAALADAVGIDRQLAHTLNVFPELFHCSGFAVFGSATSDGKLYHGRVLDYMTTIGLQDAATTFIVAPRGQHAFANVGYAGFIGSVTGMNAVGVSLGEMGGRGEGQWDGVPMSTLMRRALEECSTLEEVKELWRSSPRTCEYYYVFADGKSNQAVGVAATPDKLEFIEPGQADERLGEGIRDAVVLSAGSRLQTLRERVLEKHGAIDAETARWLMSRPVAMKSNLHNALFVPADGVLYVANADHRRPAAENPYVRLDLKQLLQELTAQ